ncbi:MAG: DM13 domain-containing protein [bacterium]|nr:DM13 domain-containing protein [bacterium]
MSERPRFYRRRSVQIAAVIVAIPVLVLAWWLVSPLFIDEVVDEPFPRAAMAIVPDNMTPEDVEQEMIDAEAVDTPAYEDMPESPSTVTTTVPATTTTAGTIGTTDSATDPEPAETTATTETTVPSTTAAPAEEPPSPEPAGPLALVTGALMDGDSFHMGSGQVTLYRLEDGSHLIRMEDIEVTNGPDLHVLLTPVHGLGGRDDLQAAGYIDLGSLKGNIGSQNYEVPAGYEIPGELTLVIYCVPFHVVFATAELA